MVIIRGDDERLTWHGCVEHGRVSSDNTSSNKAVIAPRRLRSSDAAFYDASLLAVADLAASVRISFRTNSRSIAVKLVPLGEHLPGPLRDGDGPALVGLSVNGQVVDTASVGADGTVHLETHADGMADVELWLPHRCPVGVEHLAIVDGAVIERWSPARPVWIAHGSSITQSRFSDRPSSSWTSQVARSLGLDVFNLGFAGECHLDPIVARMIASMPADLISICAGINPYTSISMSERVYRSNLAGFVKIVRDGHPTTPILLSSPIASPKRETAPNHPRLPPPFVRRLLASQAARLPTGTVGPTLAELRRATTEVGSALVAAGDANLCVVDGLALLSAGDAEHLVDGLHPDQNGEDLIAGRYTALLRPLVDAGSFG